MRILVLLMLLLAGCASSDPPELGAEEPLATKEEPQRRAPPEYEEPTEVENVSMDPVNGAVGADGAAHRSCGTVTGYGALGWARTTWTFKVGTNATTMRATAAWTPTNPTIEALDFEFLSQDQVFAFATTTPGAPFDVSVRDVPLDDRSVAMRIAHPACGAQPIAFRLYEGVSAQVRIEFHA